MLNGHEFGDGFAGLADDHFLARLNLLQQSRKMRLRLLYIGDFHMEIFCPDLVWATCFRWKIWAFHFPSGISKFDLSN